MQQQPLSFGAVVCLCLMAWTREALCQPEVSREVATAIRRGAAALEIVADRPVQNTLVGFALLKANVAANDPRIQSAINGVLKKLETGDYKPVGPRRSVTYEVGVDLLLLEAVDAERYNPQIQRITDALISNQRSFGAWNYVDDPDGTPGDVSVTQYSLLGLWAAVRADIEVPRHVWDRAARWHVDRQRTDGSFSYRPDSQNDAKATFGTTAASLNNLLLLRLMLFTGGEDRPVFAAPTKRRSSVLQRLSPTAVQNVPVPTPMPSGNSTSRADLDRSISRAKNWISNNYEIDKRLPEELHFSVYTLYTIERFSALGQIQQISGHDWYRDGCDRIIPLQMKTGHWAGFWDDPTMQIGTSLAILFLSRPTEKLIRAFPSKESIGGGLLVGGRGLGGLVNKPADGAAGKSGQKAPTEIERLLSELEKPKELDLLEAQAAVVAQVQIESRDALVGQVEKLKQLINHREADVRQTAYWALGRTANFEMVPILVKGLSDPDLAAAQEASLALCFLSRKPMGLQGVPANPPAAASDSSEENPGTNADAAADQFALWQQRATKAWQAWYIDQRPYPDRDDRNQLVPKPR